MKPIVIVQIISLLLVSGMLGGLLLTTPLYNEVQSGIVEVLCLSCIKLDPKTELAFTFETANGKDHPLFVQENLSNGPVFMEFRQDVCEACDEMAPLIKEIFDLEFEKEETFFELVHLNSANVTFMHINLDHASEELKASFACYDKDDIGGVPMFTLVSYGYDRGFIKPIYTTTYGKLSLQNDQERKDLLLTIIQDGINLYEQTNSHH